MVLIPQWQIFALKMLACPLVGSWGNMDKLQMSDSKPSFLERWEAMFCHVGTNVSKSRLS